MCTQSIDTTQHQSKPTWCVCGITKYIMEFFEHANFGLRNTNMPLKFSSPLPCKNYEHWLFVRLSSGYAIIEPSPPQVCVGVLCERCECRSDYCLFA